jgi:hypothetical protein
MGITGINAQGNISRGFDVPQSLWIEAGEAARRNGMSISEILRSALRDYVAANPAPVASKSKPAAKQASKSAAAKAIAAAIDVEPVAPRKTRKSSKPISKTARTIAARKAAAAAWDAAQMPDPSTATWGTLKTHGNPAAIWSFGRSLKSGPVAEGELLTGAQLDRAYRGSATRFWGAPVA